VKEGDRILEIGTGSGYQAAVLAAMGARVFSMERNLDLHGSARKMFDRLGYRVATKCGDGTVGWSEFAPFNGVMVTAGAPDIPSRYSVSWLMVESSSFLSATWSVNLSSLLQNAANSLTVGN